MSYVWLIGNILHGNFIHGIMSTKSLESAIGMLHSEIMIGHLWQKRTNLTGLKTIDVFTPQFFRHL
jgi:hypothetical protein